MVGIGQRRTEDDLVERLRTETNGKLRRLDANSRWGMMIVEATDRIEELERKLAKEKQYFKEINEKAWDVHSRVHQLEQQTTLLVHALQSIVSVQNPKEWREFCEGLIAETFKILKGKND